jgi:hypothetical protein
MPAARGEETVGACGAVSRIAIDHTAVRERPKEQRHNRPAPARRDHRPTVVFGEFQQTKGDEQPNRHDRRRRYTRESVS